MIDCSPYTVQALAYAEAAARGEWLEPPLSAVRRPVGELEALAARRFLADLARAAEGWTWWYDDEAAERAIGFMERLVHVKGELRGQPLRFEPAQMFGLCQLFGWRDVETGYRRFTEVYEELARKQAKSTKVAAIGLYMLVEDGELGAEVYNGATSMDQASFVWQPARQMCELTDGFQREHQLSVGVRKIEHLPSGNIWQPVIGVPGDGGNPHFAAIDEYHQHRTSGQRDAMQTGMGARRQPILYVITTGGDDTASVCFEHRQGMAELLRSTEREEADERKLVLIYAMDEGDDWRTFENMLKANPLVGVSVPESYLRAQHQDALRSPTQQGRILSRHGNRWGNTAAPFFDRAALAAALDRGRDRLDWDDLRGGVGGAKLALGLDGSIRIDFTSWVAVQQRFERGLAHYRIKARHYLPDGRLDDPRHRMLRGWADAGWIVPMAGEEIDLRIVEADLVEMAGQLGAEWLVYDSTYTQQLAQGVGERTGIARVEAPLGTARFMSPIMRELEGALAAGRVDLDGDPVLQWMLENVQAREDERGNVYPRKPKGGANSRKKIDGAWAALLGLSPFVRAVEDDGLTWGDGQEVVAA